MRVGRIAYPTVSLSSGLSSSLLFLAISRAGPKGTLTTVYLLPSSSRGWMNWEVKKKRRRSVLKAQACKVWTLELCSVLHSSEPLPQSTQELSIQITVPRRAGQTCLLCETH